MEKKIARKQNKYLRKNREIQISGIDVIWGWNKEMEAKQRVISKNNLIHSD